MEIALNLNSDQINKILKGKNVQITADQIGNGTKVMVKKTMYNKLLRLKSQNKGIRVNNNNITLDNMDGGAMSAKQFGNYIVQGLEFGKKHVPKKLVKDAMQKTIEVGAMRAGMDPAMASEFSSTMAKNSTNALYNNNFNDKNALQNAGQDFALATAKDGLNYGIKYAENKMNGGKISLGKIAQGAKKIIPKKVAQDLAQQGLNAALEKAGVENDIAKTLSNSIVKNTVDATYSTDLSKGNAVSNLKTIGMNTGMNTTKDGLNYAVNSYTSGGAIMSMKPNGGSCCPTCKRKFKGGSFKPNGRG
jgi:hypothetical protein